MQKTNQWIQQALGLLLLWPCVLYGQQVGYQSTAGSSSSTGVTQGQAGNTGGVSLNIPLASQPSDFTSVTVGLSYYSSGTRVNEVSSNVGHNWSLIAGGVITREVRDEIDDLSNPVDLPLLTSPTDNTLIGQYAEDDDLDTEPDLFSFRFGNRSGSFVLGRDGKFMVIPHQPLDVMAYTGMTGFVITTDTGMKYYFGESTAARETTQSVDSLGFPQGESKVTAWYLYKVEDRISSRVINFQYVLSAAQTETTGRSQAQYKVSDNGVCGDEPDLDQTQIWKTYTPQLQEIQTTQYGKLTFDYEGKYLTKVTRISSVDEIRAITNLLYEDHVGRRFLKSVVQTDPYGEVATAHKFNYITPENLPARLSFAQDHWGYYNGQTADTTTLLPANDVISDGWIVTEYFGMGGADRSPDPASAQIGMLESVTYPGGSITTYAYEGNTVVEPVTTYAGNQTKTDQVSDDDDAGSSVIRITSRYDQSISIGLSMTNGDQTPSGKLTVRDVLDDVVISGLNGVTFSGTDTRSFTAVQGKVYDFTIEMTDPSPSTKIAHAAISHLTPANASTTDQSIAVGGLRLAQVTYKDPLSNEETVTKYYYGTKENPTVSSGVRAHVVDYSSYITEYYKTDLTNSCEYIALNSNSSQLMNTSGNAAVRYRYMTTSVGGSNFENGGMQYEYKLEDNSEPTVITGIDIEYAPWSSDAWQDGQLKNEEVFKKDGANWVVLRKSAYSYALDTTRSDTILAQVIRKRYEAPDGYTGINKYDASYYKHHSNFSYLSQTESWTYDDYGANPIYNVSTYAYDTTHTYLTSTTATNSEGEVVTMSYKYPQDYTAPGTVISRMITDKVTAVPIETVSTVDGQVVAASATQFEYDADHNYLAARRNYNKENTTDDLVYSTDGQTFAYPYEWQSEVVKRDDQGHVLSETSRAGITTTYIRGYDGKYVVATIQNATYTEVKTALSLNDNLRITDALSGTAISTLKTQLPSARMTSYTYQVGYGISTVEDHNGKKQYYTYDTFGRVKHVKDHNGHVVSSQSYYLKN